MRLYHCDILVIGAGGAGLRAAISAYETNPHLKICLVVKDKLGRSGVTALSCSDRMAFHATLKHTPPVGKDSWKHHANDIYRLGGYVSDRNLAQILAKNASDAFEYLEKLGVPWVKKDGKPRQFITDGSDFPRACYTGPYTANDIEKALLRKMKTTGVKVIQNCMITDLLTDSGNNGRRITGAQGIIEKKRSGATCPPWWMHRTQVIFDSKTIILATGGAGEVYKFNVFPERMTGDGYAIAYRAGAELVNMEFIQFGLSSLKTKLACSGSLMRAIPRIINDRGEEFLPGYFPAGMNLNYVYNIFFSKGASWPVSLEKPSHIIDIAVFKEILNGRKVYLDFSHNPGGFHFSILSKEHQQRYFSEVKVNLGDEKREQSPFNRLQEINPDSIKWLKSRGIDLKKGEKIEIAPAAQHFQGGVKIDEFARTTIEGLYACGECAGGQHGANRPGGNSLLDTQVFGKIAGESAAKYASKCRGDISATEDWRDKYGARPYNCGLDVVPEADPPWRKSSPYNGATSARKKIQEILFQKASIVRTEKGLDEGLKELERIKRNGIRKDKKGSVYHLETLNILTVSEMVLRSAKMRRESRGPHLFFKNSSLVPRNDKKWRKYIVIVRKNGKMTLGKVGTDTTFR